MKSRLASLCSICIFLSLCYAQDQPAPGWGAKVNLEFYNDTDPFSGNTISRTHLKPAIFWGSRENQRQEVELNRLLIARETFPTGHDDRLSLFIRYQYAHYLFRPEKTLRPQLAIVWLAGMERREFKPFVSNVFRSAETRLLARIALAPGFKWQIGARCFLDFSLPLPLAELSWLKDREDNPNLSAAQSIIYTTGFETTPARRFSIRAGGGIDL